MASKKTYNLIFIIVVSVVTTIICGSLIGHFVYYNNHRDDVLTILKEGITTEEVEMDFGDFKPGTKKENTLKIKSQEKNVYVINLDFNETEDGILKKYLNVLIKADNEIIYEENLEELLNSDSVITFEKEIIPKDPLELVVQYEMPISVGNEAQNAETKIKIEITVSPKE